jgi:hypothetical protein
VSLPRLVVEIRMGSNHQPFLASSASIAAIRRGSSASTSGAKRATTFPLRSIRNFSKFHRTSAGFLAGTPYPLRRSAKRAIADRFGLLGDQIRVQGVLLLTDDGDLREQRSDLIRQLPLRIVSSRSVHHPSPSRVQLDDLLVNERAPRTRGRASPARAKYFPSSGWLPHTRSRSLRRSLQPLCTAPVHPILSKSGME